MLRNLWESILLQFYHRMGVKALRQGKYEKASRLIQKALLISNTPEYQYDFAVVLLSMNRYSEAAFYLQKVLVEYPDNEMALLAFAQCKTMLRDWDAVQDVYAKLSAEHPTNLNYRHYREIYADVVQRERLVCSKELIFKAQQEVEKHNLDAALQHLQEAEAFDPANAQIPNNMAAIMLSMKKPYPEILSYFEKGLHLDPENPKIQQNMLYIRRKMGL